MASLKNLRLRIRSIKSTQKITKAMHMVSASKLRHAREKLENAEAYTKGAEVVLSALRTHKRSEEGRIEKLLFSNDSSKKMLAIVVTSERGLCGGFNQSIIRLAKADIAQAKASGVEVKIITIGKKGQDALQPTLGSDFIAHYPNSSITSIAEIAAIYQNFIQTFTDGSFDSCKLYFNFFKNTATQVPTAKSLIPMEQQEETNLAYEYEGEELLQNAITAYLKAEIYHSLLQSKTSEEAARMMAMDNATRNAGEMITKLTLSLNRSRQASITTELIEIISGAEAV